jgi:hypothetical protein
VSARLWSEKEREREKITDMGMDGQTDKEGEMVPKLG